MLYETSINFTDQTHKKMNLMNVDDREYGSYKHCVNVWFNRENGEKSTSQILNLKK